ncbi:MAG TPA: hypothetical protein VF070_40840 [Streptosporangiaceae bacterium]
MTLGIDIGTLTVKVATEDGVTAVPAPSGGPRAGIRAALAAVGPRGLCVAVPDAWLTGTMVGASLQEDVRYEIEDLAGAGPVVWTGQLAAVAALVAERRGSGRYLVCDVGGAAVRVGLFKASDGGIEVIATHTADGGGWRDFDAAMRSGTPAGLPDTWYEQAAGQESRANVVFADAVASPEEFGETRVYRISGPSGHIDLTASHVIDGFAPTLRRLWAGIKAVSDAGPAEGVVLTGGVGWLPLAVRALTDATGITPVAAGLDAAARGALLFARGEIHLIPSAERQEVALPAHQTRDGLLEEVSVILPWTAPFATLPGGALTIDREELELTVAGRSRTARLHGLLPGPHRVGVRSTWPGPGVLVVRPVAGDGAHVVPLASLTER